MATQSFFLAFVLFLLLSKDADASCSGNKCLRGRSSKPHFPTRMLDKDDKDDKDDKKGKKTKGKSKMAHSKKLAKASSSTISDSYSYDSKSNYRYKGHDYERSGSNEAVSRTTSPRSNDFPTTPPTTRSPITLGPSLLPPAQVAAPTPTMVPNPLPTTAPSPTLFVSLVAPPTTSQPVTPAPTTLPPTTPQPVTLPTVVPTPEPSPLPSPLPTPLPTLAPSPLPSPQPTPGPTSQPSDSPNMAPIAPPTTSEPTPTSSPTPTHCMLDVVLTCVNSDGIACGDLLLASDADCILTLTFQYAVQNTGGAPVMLTSFFRNRNGDILDLLNGGMMVELGPGLDSTGGETVQVDLCAAGPSGSVTTVEARAESILVPGADCLGAAEHALIAPDF